MLAVEEIGRIDAACGELPLERVFALSLAAVHRILPVYQVYSEIRAESIGYESVHDGLVGMWRVLRARPGATIAELTPRLEDAIRGAELDVQAFHADDDLDIAGSLAVEAISAVALAMRAYIEKARSLARNAMMGALEVDVVWAEWLAGSPDGQGVVEWSRLRAHYEFQVRDVAALLRVDKADEKDLFRDISMRAEREGLPVLVRMRELVSNATP